MAKISLSLVFALVLSVALHSVLCDDNPWESVIEQAKSEANKAGFSDETIFGAEKAVADGSAERAAQQAFGGGSLNDWVQHAGGMGNEESSSSDAVQSFPDYDEEDNKIFGEIEFAPKRFTSQTPSEAPSEALSEKLLGKLSEAPSEEPSEAPSEEPSEAPSEEPSEAPSEAPQAQKLFAE